MVAVTMAFELPSDTVPAQGIGLCLFPRHEKDSLSAIYGEVGMANMDCVFA
jgi:hypothetical protein